MSLFWNSNPSAPFWGNTASFFWQADGALYSYDLLGRLTGITYPNGTTITYSYDSSVGNRTSVVTTCGSGGC